MGCGLVFPSFPENPEEYRESVNVVVVWFSFSLPCGMGTYALDRFEKETVQMKKSVFGCVLVGALALVSVSAHAVGPTIPPHAKYSPCSVTGIVISNFNQDNNSPACPSGYEEKTTKLFVNNDTGTIAVVFPDTKLQPEFNTCVFVTGVLLPPCYGDDRPICVVTAVSEDFSCDPEAGGETVTASPEK